MTLYSSLVNMRPKVVNLFLEVDTPMVSTRQLTFFVSCTGWLTSVPHSDSFVWPILHSIVQAVAFVMLALS